MVVQLTNQQNDGSISQHVAAHPCGAAISNQSPRTASTVAPASPTPPPRASAARRSGRAPTAERAIREAIAAGEPQLFDCQLRDGRVDYLAWHANDLDTVGLAEFLPDRGFGQMSLPVHEACRRISELGGQAHNRGRTI